MFFILTRKDSTPFYRGLNSSSFSWVSQTGRFSFGRVLSNPNVLISASFDLSIVCIFTLIKLSINAEVTLHHALLTQHDSIYAFSRLSYEKTQTATTFIRKSAGF
jgi:hypothetical protein